ncbi:MAG: 1-deoxy-D-xylulose-5-phosphate reductoisomerase, partial [Clostridia bacterium]|nr:1-deoxy-D-xylulose-5-phosphate reductoisomerase [Clostridia bacterium]
MKKIALVGSTGSIGRQVLNVVRRHSDKFQIVSLAAGGNTKLLAEQIKEFNPLVATSAFKADISILNSVEYYYGDTAFTNAIISEADIVVIALVGFKGIIAVLDAIKKGKNIALANKESLVVGGELVTSEAKKAGVSIVPIDSEHSALWQALSFDMNKPFKKLILTASGGAFRDFNKEQLKTVKASDALKHPNWNMGNKITIDCATLVNKGFEVCEAKWLYNTTFDKIDVIIHRESIIHSMVEYEDGSVISQMSLPNMEIPIQLALTYPERLKTNIEAPNFATLKKLSFEEPDYEKFPCLKLVIDAGVKGGAYPAVINGANEVAVEYFLKGLISFNDIYSSLYESVSSFKGG